MSEYTISITEKLGGIVNLNDVSSCITRLRLTVKDPDKVDDAALKALGVKGVIKKGSSVQVVVGTHAEFIADEMNRLMKNHN